MNLNHLGQVYEEQTQDLLAITPPTARGSRLLVVGGSPAECRYYASSHWKPVALLFGLGMVSEHRRSVTEFIQASASSTEPLNPSNSPQFDAVVINTVLGLSSDPALLLQRIAPLLNPGARIHARLRSLWYHGDLAIRAGREAYPWPGMQPLGNGWDKAAILAPGAFGPFRVVSLEEDWDGLYHDPRQASWQQINAWDVSVRLSSDPVQRAETFVRSWRLVLEDGNPKVGGEVAEAVNAVALQQQIERLLDDARLDEAGLLIDKMHRLGLASAATWNLQGIYQFYRQDYPQAFASFRMACSLDPAFLDAHRNLLDAGDKCGRMLEATELVLRDAHNTPALKELLHG